MVLNQTVPRDTVHQILRAIRCKPATAVSSKTDLLIVGTSPGQNKLLKAMEHGTPVVPQLLLHLWGILPTLELTAGSTSSSVDSKKSTHKSPTHKHETNLYGNSFVSSLLVITAAVYSDEITRLVAAGDWGRVWTLALRGEECIDCIRRGVHSANEAAECVTDPELAESHRNDAKDYFLLAVSYLRSLENDVSIQALGTTEEARHEDSV